MSFYSKHKIVKEHEKLVVRKLKLMWRCKEWSVIGYDFLYIGWTN